MLRFQPWPDRWWNKPLVNLGGRALPAELAVLAAEVGPGERGAWLNSRGTASGVVDLVREDGEGGRPVFKTRREPLPSFVSAALEAVYEKSGLARGCPDLVIWHPASRRVRLVDVKCPHWNGPSAEQEEFMAAAATLGVPTCVAEWEFAGPLAEHAVVGNDQIVARACQLAGNDPDAAAELLRAAYPFVPSRPKRRSFTKRQAMEVFFRDAFTDRYSGERLVNPGALYMLGHMLPDDFPCHPHGRRDQTHVAFWELMPTVDHVVPLALGGAHELENFATTSMLRNLAKRNARLEQLGWTLYDAGRLTEWDGLSGWFVTAFEGDPEARRVPLLDGWYCATNEMLRSGRR